MEKTQQQIQQEFEKNYSDSILSLQSAFGGRVGSLSKLYSKKIQQQDGTLLSVIQDVVQADSTDAKVSPDILYQKYLVDVIDKKYVSNSPNVFGFVVLDARATYVSGDATKWQINESVFYGSTELGRNQVAWSTPSIPEVIKASSYSELRTKLSGILYPSGQIQRSDSFNAILEAINTQLKTSKIIPIKTLTVFVVPSVQIPSGYDTGNFNLIFPKPDGYIGVDGQAQATATATGTGTTTPQSGIGTASPSSIPQTPTQPQQSGAQPQIQQSAAQSPSRKYLSIEAVQDDEVPLPQPTGSLGSRIISTRALKDSNDLLFDRTYRAQSGLDGTEEQDLVNVVSEFQQGDDLLLNPPRKTVVAGGTANTEVARNEQREAERRTEQQRRLEDADSASKDPTKQKGVGSVLGAGTADGISSTNEANRKPIPEDKKPPIKPQTKPTKEKTFIAWMTKEGKDPNGIIYRGTNPVDYPNQNPNIDVGNKPNRFKNLFGFGSNLNAIFKGYSVESPIDVALLMNSGGVGRFNKNWPYMFGEGSEIHAAITRATSVAKESSGGIGTFGANRAVPDANWAANPHWCGLCTNFMLQSNGKYKADASLSDITSTASVIGYYNESPFNIPGDPVENKKKEIKKIDNDIIAIKKKQSGNTNSIKKKEKEKLRVEDNLAKIMADTTNVNQRKKQSEEIKLNRIDKEIDLLRKLDNDYTTQIQSLEKERRAVEERPLNEYNLDGKVAKFSRNIHWDAQGLTPKGKELLSKISDWPGGYIVRRSSKSQGGHVETLLHFSPSGELYTIGGNTGLENSDGNGSEYGFKKYTGIWQFNSKGKFESFFVVKRGIASPYTNGIGATVKSTSTYRKYVNDLSTDKELNTAAYNILRNIVEI